VTEAVLKPDTFGCPGNGTPIDPENWEKLLSTAVEQGGRIVFSGTYDLRRVRTFRVEGSLRMGAERPGEAILKGGRKGLHMLDLRSGELVFCGIRTENIALVHGRKYASRMAGPIDRIELLDWEWRNRTVPAFALARRSPKKTRPGATVIGRLTIGGIRGHGGLGGIAVVAPIAEAEVDDVRISGLRVPDSARYYHRRKNGKLAMTNIGYGVGLDLGEDTPGAAAACTGRRIGNVTIAGISDFRDPAGLESDCLASVDGVRITLPNQSVGRIRVRNVWSRQKRDTTGAYFKAQNSVVEDLAVIDSGGHEGSVVIKSGGGVKAPGDGIEIRKLSIQGTGDVRRAALYLGTDNIRLGRVRIQGMGGDVAGVRLPSDEDAYGPLVHMQRFDDKGSITIDSLRITDCALFRDTETAAVLMQGYRDVKIGRLRIEGLSASTADGRKKMPCIGVMLGSRHPVFSVSIGRFGMTDAVGRGPVAFKQTSAQTGSVGAIAIGRMRLDRSIRRGLWFVGEQAADLCRIGDLRGMAVKDCVHPRSDRTALPKRLEIEPPDSHDSGSAIS